MVKLPNIQIDLKNEDSESDSQISSDESLKSCNIDKAKIRSLKP